MKIAIYNGKKDVQIKEVDTPHASDNDIVIKNIYSSICGTDVAVYLNGAETGHKVDVGGEFGHETISQVVEVGKNVKDLKVGDIVYPYPLLAKDDPKRAGTLGGFSEYILIPNCVLNKSVYKLKEGITLKEACLIEPFTVGCRAARRSSPKKGENAIVFGAGTIGIAAAISLKYFGCNKVMIVDISDYRLEKCKELGFEVCNSNKENLENISKEYFGESFSRHGKTADIDIFIDAAGAESILKTYQNMGKIESRLVVVAVLKGERPVDILDMTYSQHAIIGSGGYFPIDVEDVMNIMASKKWNIESIITHEYEHKNICTALEMAGNTNESLNVVIKF
jgi:2-desacetyl-2-hydroxyethyl bacteriochlorophyllide A dehydrogenase